MSDDLTFWSLVWNRNGRWFGRPSCIICRFILQLEASGHLQRPGVNWGSSYLMELQGLCPSLAWREDAGGVFRRAAAHSAGRCRLVQALVWFCIASMFSSIFLGVHEKYRMPVSFQQNATSWRKYLSPPHLCPRTLRPTGRHSQHLSKGDKLAGPYIWHVKDPRLVYSLVPRVLTECVYLRTSGFACVLCSRCHPTNSDQTLDNSQGPWAQSMLQLNRDAPRWDFRHEQQALDTSERVTVKIVKIAVDLAVGEVCLHSLDSIP